MSVIAVAEILRSVIAGIEEIDKQCATLLNGVEHGVVNVKLEFKDRALRETGKKLTEEPLIAWLLHQKLSAMGWNTDWEVPYPANRSKSCDLVVTVNETCRLWLELKLAWKAWFNCVGEPKYSNRAYPSYLDGHNRTHSFGGDLLKLSGKDWAPGDYRAVLLIGFDWVQEPMDEDVMSIVRQSQNAGQPWKLVAERHWTDRRSADFRINVWSWALPPFV